MHRTFNLPLGKHTGIRQRWQFFRCSLSIFGSASLGAIHERLPNGQTPQSSFILPSNFYQKELGGWSNLTVAWPHRGGSLYFTANNREIPQRAKSKDKTLRLNTMMVATQWNDLLVSSIEAAVFIPLVMVNRMRNPSHLTFVYPVFLKFSLTALKMATSKWMNMRLSSTIMSKQQSAASPFSTHDAAIERSQNLAKGLINNRLSYRLWPVHKEFFEQKKHHTVVSIRNNRFEAALAVLTAKPVKRSVKQS